MNEIRDNGHDAGQSPLATEAGQTVTNASEPAKVETIAAVLIDREASDPALNHLEENVSAANSQKEIPSVGHKAAIVQGIGHQLSSARMARGMSIEDVSRQLRISVQQIEAIEKEDFARLPGRTFLRGFIRNYANLMQLDPEPILKQLPSSPSMGGMANSNYQERGMSFTSRKAWSGYNYRSEKNYSVILKPALGLVLLLIGYGIYQSIDWGRVPVANQEIKTEAPLNSSAETGTGIVELDLPLPSATALNEQNLHQPEQASDIAPFLNHPGSFTERPVPADSPASATSSSSGELHFEFADESWVEVKDSQDKTIFEQLNAGGTEQIIKGERPLSLVIGNASDVKLTYNGRSVDLVPYTDEIKGVARFTLE